MFQSFGEGVLAVLLAALAGGVLGYFLRSRALRRAETAGIKSLTLLKAAEDRLGALDQEHQARVAADQKAALADQKVEDMLQRMADWEKTKAETIQAAKAGALESARELSKKLVEDHRRETETARKESERKALKFQEQFEKIVSTVGSLHDQVAESRRVMDAVERSLSSPGGVGHFAEGILENQFKALGLEADRDFILQHTVEAAGGDGRLRPDAVVFLPGGSVMVIDVKASKYLIEMAEAEGQGGATQSAGANLAETMNGHLKALTLKNYRDAVAASFRDSGRKGRLGHVISVMYLPSDGALERLLDADPAFGAKAQKAQIMVVGPSGLTALLAVAHLTIGAARREANQELIVEETGVLLERLADMLGFLDKVGRGVRQAAENIGKMGRSINTRLLPVTRRLDKLGVGPKGGKALPGKVTVFQVTQLDDFINAESEEVTPAAELTDQRQEETP